MHVPISPLSAILFVLSFTDSDLRSTNCLERDATGKHRLFIKVFWHYMLVKFKFNFIKILFFLIDKKNQFQKSVRSGYNNTSNVTEFI